MPTIPEEEFKSLQQIAETDPDFVTAYLSACDKENGSVRTERTVNAELIKNYSVRDAAKILGVCKNTVIYHIKNGKIKANQEESSSGKRWMIPESELTAFRASKDAAKTLRQVEDSRAATAVLQYLKNPSTFFPRQEPKEKGADMLVKYPKASSQNVVDFLLHWENRFAPGFSTTTLCRDFNAVCDLSVSETQISGILSTLAKKGIVNRLGRGLYQFVLPAGYEKKEVKVDSVNEDSDSDVLTIPVAEREERHTDQFKKSARLALEEFFARHSNPDEDFHFSIDMVANEYPKINRNDIAKAIQNVHHWSKHSPNPEFRVERAEGMGNYVKLGKPKPKDDSNDLLQDLLELLKNHASKKK